MKNELAEIESPGPNSTALERQHTSEMCITVNTLGLKWPIFTSLGKQASIFQLKHRLHLLATLRAVLCISAAWLSWYWGRENELSPVQSKWASIVMWLWVTVADSAVTGYKWKRKKKKKNGKPGLAGGGKHQLLFQVIHSRRHNCPLCHSPLFLLHQCSSWPDLLPHLIPEGPLPHY